MFKAVSASPFSGHRRNAGNIFLTSPEAPTHWLVNGIHELINEHGHSFEFVRVYSKFVKDIVPSRCNVSDITEECH